MRQVLSSSEIDALALLGGRIRLARTRRGLTQAEVANRAGIHRQTVVSLEAGKTGVSLGALIGVLAALGLQEKLASTLELDERGEEIDLGRKARVGGPRGAADF